MGCLVQQNRIAALYTIIRLDKTKTAYVARLFPASSPNIGQTTIGQKGFRMTVMTPKFGMVIGSIRALKGCYNTQERQNQERQAFREVVSFSLSERSGLGVGADGQAPNLTNN